MGTDTARTKTRATTTRRWLQATLLALFTVALAVGIVWWTRKPATLRVVSRTPVAGDAPMLVGPDGYLLPDTPQRLVYRDWAGAIRWAAELDKSAGTLAATSLSPDGTRLAALIHTPTETHVRLWREGRPVRTVKLPGVDTDFVQATDDGAVFAWNGSPRARTAVLHAWTPAGAHREAVRSVAPEGPDDIIAMMDLSPDGTQLLVRTATRAALVGDGIRTDGFKASLGATVRLGEKTLTIDPTSGPRIDDAQAYPLGEGRAVTPAGALYADGSKVTFPGTTHVCTAWDGRHLVCWKDRAAEMVGADGTIMWTVPGVRAERGTLAPGGGAFVARAQRTDPPAFLRVVRDILPGPAARLWAPGGAHALVVATAPGRVAATAPMGEDGTLADGAFRLQSASYAIAPDGRTVVALGRGADTTREAWVWRW